MQPKPEISPDSQFRESLDNKKSSSTLENKLLPEDPIVHSQTAQHGQMQQRRDDLEQYESVDSDFVFVGRPGERHDSLQPKIEKALAEVNLDYFACDEPPSDFLKREDKITKHGFAFIPQTEDQLKRSDMGFFSRPRHSYEQPEGIIVTPNQDSSLNDLENETDFEAENEETNGYS